MENVEKDLEEEMKLAKDMKENYCDKHGKEKNPAEAAGIIHKIGLIYRKRSPNKIALVKSAGLFNAAILRNPSNISQIKYDLSELCRHILQLANATKQNVDLTKEAENVKVSINKLRQKVEEYLKTNVQKLPESTPKSQMKQLQKEKIPIIMKLNKTIAKKYKQIMSELSQFCENVLGKPPCEYAVAGMGSIAREEITPYSDFEHIILLCNQNDHESCLEYFRWFSVIFHIIILNVQETILPSLHISSLNDKESVLGDWYYDAITPRGLSLDGMMPHACKNPLGRQQHTKRKLFTTELIKPVNEMLEYLSSESDLKQGYHLADILTKTCFVFGNEDVHKQFLIGLQKEQNTKSETDTIKDIQKQVKDDLNNFSTRFRLTNMKLKNTINIKQLVYRSSTIFISALARKHKISANSSFEIIKELEKTKKITQNVANKLQYAVAVACEIRLRIYINKQSQCDNVVNLDQDGIKKLMDIVGVASIINYFQIAYCLQCELAKQLNFTKLYFYSDPQLINITIGLAFGIKSFKKFSTDLQNPNWRLNKFDFDECIDHLETANELASNVAQSAKILSSQENSDTELIKTIADSLKSLEIYDESLDFYQQLLHLYQNKSEDKDQNYDVSWVNYQIGYCLFKINRPAQALKYHERSLEIRQSISQQLDADKWMAILLHEIGLCHIDLYNYNEALAQLNRSLKIKQNITLNADTDRSIAVTIHEIGRCHNDLNNYDEALKKLNQALEIYHNTSRDPDTDRSIGITLHNIGRCHIDINNYDKALPKLNQALEIKQATSLNPDTDRSIAVTLYKIGSCHIGLQNYDKALKMLNRAIEITEITSLDLENDQKLGITLLNIGKCLSAMQQYDEAWKSLEQSLKIFQNTSVDESTEQHIGHAFNYMGECLIRKRQYTEAFSYLQKANAIYQNQLNKNSVNYARALHNTGVCLMELQENENAQNYLKHSLTIYENLPLNKFMKNKIQVICDEINGCLSEI